MKQTPNNILLEELVKERNPAELENDLNNAENGRKPASIANTNENTLLWNNAVESAAKRLRERGRKRVSFDEGSKEEDGGNEAKAKG